MTTDVVVDITRQTLFLIIRTALPMLLVSLCVGLAVSIFQTVTSIQEQTLTFVPKVLSIFFSIIIFGNWIMTSIVEFMTELWSGFNLYIHS